MKKMLVLLAVAMMTTNMVGCCCCGKLRDYWYRGAYCGPTSCAPTAAVGPTFTPAMATPYAYSAAPTAQGCEVCCSPCCEVEPSCGMPSATYGMGWGQGSDCVGCDTGYGVPSGDMMIIPGPGSE